MFQKRTITSEQKQKFSFLAFECMRHVTLHRERVHALLNVHKGILSSALISPH